MSEDAVLVILAISFLCFITFTFLEVQKTLQRIRLGIEKNGVLLTSVNEKLDGLATLNDKLGSVSENLFDISERFDAPGIARKKSDKRTQEIKALLDRLASDLPKTTRPIGSSVLPACSDFGKSKVRTTSTAAANSALGS
jgi:hypothetical protein